MLTSYAQNFEDVMLWRALKDVGKGFYIDVGAQDPVVDSVSLAFYEQGWRGVHVEPVTKYAEKLRAARPDEVVIQAVIGGGSGVRSLFEIEDTGLSTGDAHVAAMHTRNGFPISETVVPTISLGDLLEMYKAQPIHWLKIDVEGMEAEVLQSWQPSEVRPWIVVIESTLPTTQTETHLQWEAFILALGYDFVYFDGLNRYYVSRCQERLKVFFGTPPNFFDGFALSGTSGVFCTLLNKSLAEREREANAARTQVAELQGRVTLGQEEMQRLTAAVTEREREAIAARAQVVELQGRVTLGQEEMQRLRADVAEREQQASTARAQVAELQGRATVAQEEIQRLIAAVTEREREANAARAQVAELQGRVTLGQEEMHRLRAAVTEREREANAARTQVAELQGRVTLGQEEMQHLRVAVTERERETNTARAQVAELQGRAAVAQEEMQRLTAAATEREREAIAARTQVAELQGRVTLGQEEMQRLTAAATEREREATAARAQVAELQGHAHHWRVVADNKNKELESVHASTSWRITAPLRFGKRCVSGIWNRLFCDLRTRMRHTAKLVIRSFIAALQSKPQLKHRIVLIVKWFGLYAVLRRLYGKVATPRALGQVEGRQNVVGNPKFPKEDLSPWGQMMMTRLTRQKLAGEGTETDAHSHRSSRRADDGL